MKRRLQDYLSYVRKSEFLKNSLILVSGTTISQLMPLAIMPILSRIYTPEDFGSLTMFMTITIWGSMIINGRYELAMNLPKKDDYAVNLLAFSILLALFSALIIQLVIVLFHQPIINLLEIPQLKVWIYMLPLSMFLLASYTTLSYYSTRQKEYKLIARSQIFRGIVTTFAQLGLFFTNGVTALIGGYVLGLMSGNWGMIKKTLKDIKTHSVKKLKMLAVARRYRHFPQIQMPSSLLNRLGNDIPNVLINPIFGSEFLGHYAFGYRLLTIPSTFVGTSVSKVFMQQATEEYHRTGKNEVIFKSVLKKLLVVAIPFFLILGFSAKFLFVIVFGKQWEQAGLYAQILSPLLFIRFVTSIMSSVLFICEKHKLIFIFQLALFFLTLAVFVLSYFLHWKFILFLTVFSATLTTYYLAYGYTTWLVAKAKL